MDALQIDTASVLRLKQIPFLPISFFKSQAVQSGDFEPEVIFESSGTTGSQKSHHRVRDLSLYTESFIKGFDLTYGAVYDWCIIGLLPSYLERKNSSLTYMVDKLIRLTNHPQSGFYRNDYAKLYVRLDCGQEFRYDWNEMRIGEPVQARPYASEPNLTRRIHLHDGSG